MNEPTEIKRMTSLDRRIEASKRCGELERQQHIKLGQPMGGLTSIASTAGCNIANDPLKPKPVGDIDIPIICMRGADSIELPPYLGQNPTTP